MWWAAWNYAPSKYKPGSWEDIDRALITIPGLLKCLDVQKLMKNAATTRVLTPGVYGTPLNPNVSLNSLVSTLKAGPSANFTADAILRFGPKLQQTSPKLWRDIWVASMYDKVTYLPGTILEMD